MVEDLLPRALEAAFAAPPSTSSNTEVQETRTIPNGFAIPTDGAQSWPEAPVARVNSVAPSSPAAESVSSHSPLFYILAVLRVQDH